MITSAKHNILLITLFTTVLVWTLVAYKTAAVLTGRLGPVSYRWTNLARDGQYASWSTRAVVHSFDKQNHLLIPPNSKVQFIIDPPRHFGRMSVTIDHSGDLGLRAEYRRENNGDFKADELRDVRLGDLAKLKLGYRFTITNESANQAIVRGVAIKFLR